MSLHRSWSALACIALVSLASAPSRAGGTFDIPPGAHFNQQKLARIGEFFRNEVSTGKIAGAILLIQQHGKPVYRESFGYQDVATKAPITDKTIFRLLSMTKPITSVAAMTLIDDGKVRLDDPVAVYIPSFATAKVGVEKRAGNGDQVLELAPLKRRISIRHLLTHTSGITYGFYGDSMVRRAYGSARLYDGDFDNKEFAGRIAALPLAEQPGTLWDYGHSTDVLGRVIEVASGKSLLQYERERLLDPLGMTDTVFFVTDPEKQKLMAQPLPDDRDYRVGEGNPDRFMKWESGGGGMVSTLADFSKFAQMLLNGGSYQGRRYLSAKSFELMASDHIGKDSGIARDYFYFPGDGFGFGLGFGVRTGPGTARPPTAGSLGELKWDGASGCYFVIDRKQDMFFVLLEQTSSERQRIQRAVKQLIYEAMEN